MKNIKTRPVLEWGVIAIGGLILCATLDPAISSDGAVRYQALLAMLGKGGQLDIKFSLLQPILSLPLAWFSEAFGKPLDAVVAYYNLLIFLVCAIAIYVEVARRFSREVGRFWLLITMTGSMFPHHLQLYFSEVATSLFLTLSVLYMRRNRLLAMVLLALAVTNTPALLPAAIITSLLWWYFERSLGPILGCALALALMSLETYVKTGGHFSIAYLSSSEHGLKTILPYSGLSGFSYPALFGVLSVLMSFGKGLIFYIPGLCMFCVPEFRRELAGDRSSLKFGMTFFLLTVLTYGQWWAWYGGAFWGPRFFLYTCMPAALILAVLLSKANTRGIRAAAIMACVSLSAWVCIDGYVYAQRDMDACWQGNRYQWEFLCWYVPEFSALWRPFVTGRINEFFREPRAAYAVWAIISVAYMLVIFVFRSGCWQDLLALVRKIFKKSPDNSFNKFEPEISI